MLLLDLFPLPQPCKSWASRTDEDSGGARTIYEIRRECLSCSCLFVRCPKLIQMKIIQCQVNAEAIHLLLNSHRLHGISSSNHVTAINSAGIVWSPTMFVLICIEQKNIACQIFVAKQQSYKVSRFICNVDLNGCHSNKSVTTDVMHDCKSILLKNCS
ncbi:hypothetical protein GUJ93_ZPchr0009g1232 [Zizania palustris]|uniref:Uncharacterized protein n=1 Tax=Zizania palustris TaxID=103762 RepID=A0A8J5RSA0_ZIZPA|nr:hypothetical protein GUJ93_ZPchr0009g1232 [Zizania palustris]